MVHQVSFHAVAVTFHHTSMTTLRKGCRSWRKEQGMKNRQQNKWKNNDIYEPLEKQVTHLTDMNDQLLKKLNEKDKYMESKMNEKEDIIANLTKVNNQLNVKLKDSQSCFSGQFLAINFSFMLKSGLPGNVTSVATNSKETETETNPREECKDHNNKWHKAGESFMYQCNWCKCGCNTLPDGSTRCGAACTK